MLGCFFGYHACIHQKIYFCALFILSRISLNGSWRIFDNNNLPKSRLFNSTMNTQPANNVDSSVKDFQDRGWAWVVAFGAFLVHFLTAGCEKAFSLWYIEILDVFETNSATAASLGGICASIRLILGGFNSLFYF